jgi:pyruvate dehydrogenase E1 component alpha subunit
MTYRVDPHSTADDPSRYRTREEEASWQRLDPIERYRRFLIATGLADEAFFEQIEEETQRLARTIRTGVTSPQPGPISDLLESVFAEMPATLASQRDEAISLAGAEREPSEPAAR